MRLDILTGLMLGDGYIGYPNKGSKKPRLEVERTAYEQGYNEWLKENIALTWKADTIRTSKRAKYGDYHGVKIKSSCDPQLIPIHQVWYGTGRRAVPKEWILEHFNEVSLAVWFMDDGCVSYRESRLWSPNAKSYELIISSQNFTHEEMEWMADLLEEKYGIRWHIDGKARLKLYKREAVMKFFDIIEPTVAQIPCMLRKIHK